MNGQDWVKNLLGISAQPLTTAPQAVPSPKKKRGPQADYGRTSITVRNVTKARLDKLRRIKTPATQKEFECFDAVVTRLLDEREVLKL